MNASLSGTPVAALLALLAGAALTLSFAPTGWWPLAPLCLLVLYALLTNRTPRRAALIGWSFGVGYFGLGVSWVYHSLHLFGGATASFAIFLTALFVLVMTLFPAMTAWCWAVLMRRGAIRPAGVTARMAAGLDKPVTSDGLAPAPPGALGAACFAALWILSELLRNAIMGGFPWILIGYSQTTAPLGALAPVVGVYGIGLVLLAGTLLLLPLARGPSRTDRVAALAVLGVLVASTLWASGQRFSEPLPETIGVRLAQANIAQEMKFSRERLQRSLDDYLALTMDGLGDDIDLVVWPETAIPTDFENVRSYLAPTVRVLDARGIDVLAGGFDRTATDSYNAVRQLGGTEQVYRKRHIVPFGEYLPLRGVLEVFAAFIVIPGSDLSRGSGPHVPLEVAGQSVGVSICYEDVFGEEMRPLLPASTLLVNVSNDAWFGDSAAPHQHEQKARMRAREMGRAMVRVTNTGVSSAITHDGAIIGRIPQGVAGVLDVRIEPRTGTTPYVRFGNWPVLVLCLTIVAFAAFAARRRRRA